MGGPEETNITTCELETVTTSGVFVTSQNQFDVLFYGDNIVGSVVTARCHNDAFVLPGTNVFFCTYNGTWYPELPSNCTAPAPTSSPTPLDNASDEISGDRLILIASWGGVGGALLLVLFVLCLAMCIHKALKKPKETVEIGMSSRSNSLVNGIGTGDPTHAYANEVALPSTPTALSTALNAYTNHVAVPSTPVIERAVSENNYNYRRDRDDWRRRDERSNSYEMQIPRPMNIYSRDDHPARYQHARPNVYAREPFAEYDWSRDDKF